MNQNKYFEYEYNGELYVIPREWLEEHDKQTRAQAVKEYKEDNEDWGEEYCKLVDSYSAKCKEVRELKDKNRQIREEVIEEFYNLLANELLWVLEKFGDDVYMDIRNSIHNVQGTLFEKNEG